MTTTVLPRAAASRPGRHRGILLAVAIAVFAWFLLIVSLGAVGAFSGPPGKPPLPIAIAFAAPVALFLAWMRLSRSFREFVSSLDLRLVVGMQAWRFAGLGFFFLYAHKVIPAVLAVPAGLGDMAVAVTAPWMVLALLHNPGLATGRAFVRWNLLGILDFVVAMGIGALGAMFATGRTGEISTAPMVMLPQLLIPAFLVPFFFILHIVALLQGRELARTRA